jgi:hypothetical protein
VLRAYWGERYQIGWDSEWWCRRRGGTQASRDMRKAKAAQLTGLRATVTELLDTYERFRGGGPNRGTVRAARSRGARAEVPPGT